jgi:dTDP-4-dehydrorhamnose reductase
VNVSAKFMHEFTDCFSRLRWNFVYQCSHHLLLSFSSDPVFDGTENSLYTEEDAPRPLNAYGRAKAVAEPRVTTAAPKALVIRTAAFFGPWHAHNFITSGLRALRSGKTWTTASDQEISPTYIPNL